MKSVLISIQPKWCELIASGKKTVEIRKTKPKIEMPFKCYIYCTISGTTARERDRNIYTDLRGKVIGEFICDCILSHCEMANADIAEQQGCIKREKLFEYANSKELYGWHISDLVIYDKPKELTEFYTLDNKAVQKCENRIQTYYSFTDTGYIKNGMYCDYRDDWCIKCKRKLLKRPPQSWCYVEEKVKNNA